MFKFAEVDVSADLLANKATSSLSKGTYPNVFCSYKNAEKWMTDYDRYFDGNQVVILNKRAGTDEIKF